MSKCAKYVLEELKPRFNAAQDLLVMSEDQLDEVLTFDNEGWLDKISANIWLFGNELKNVAVVSCGYL